MGYPSSGKCSILGLEVAMSRITIPLPEECLAKLDHRAAGPGITVKELARLSLDELLARTDGAFEQAIERVLEKNQGLYERLADLKAC
jgi:hypothetical protein